MESFFKKKKIKKKIKNKKFLKHKIKFENIEICWYAGIEI